MAYSDLVRNDLATQTRSVVHRIQSVQERRTFPAEERRIVHREVRHKETLPLVHSLAGADRDIDLVDFGLGRWKLHRRRQRLLADLRILVEEHHKVVDQVVEAAR